MQEQDVALSCAMEFSHTSSTYIHPKQIVQMEIRHVGSLLAQTVRMAAKSSLKLLTQLLHLMIFLTLQLQWKAGSIGVSFLCALPSHTQFWRSSIRLLRAEPLQHLLIVLDVSKSSHCSFGLSSVQSLDSQLLARHALEIITMDQMPQNHTCGKQVNLCMFTS